MDLEALKADIKNDEGFRPFAYYDSAGFLTIGYGRMIDKKLNGGINTNEADFLLTNDINSATQQCEQHFSWFSKLSDPRQRAITEMCFNMGMPRLLGFVNMLIAIENYNFKEAAVEALNSKWAAQVPARAARIAGMLQTG